MADGIDPDRGSPARRNAQLAGTGDDFLVPLLDVERLDTDLFRGARKPGGKGRVFGGQVIAQALMAAVGSVDQDRQIHSLHAYFMRAGNEDFPIIFRVERDFDGGSFSNRRVIAMQQGQPILNLTASFHRHEDGFTHQSEMPDVPAPESLRNEQALVAENADTLPEPFVKAMTQPRQIELRPVESWLVASPDKDNPTRSTWFRAAKPVGDDAGMHRAILAYASDMTLLGTCMRPHGITWFTPGMQSASLDHAIWFHADARVDDWLLYACDSDWSGGGRGVNRGRIFTRDGKLIATTAQEGLIRYRGDREDLIAAKTGGEHGRAKPVS